MNEKRIADRVANELTAAGPTYRIREAEKKWAGYRDAKAAVDWANKNGVNVETFALKLGKVLPTWFTYVGGHHVAILPYYGSRERVMMVEYTE